MIIALVLKLNLQKVELISFAFERLKYYRFLEIVTAIKFSLNREIWRGIDN